MIFYINRQWRPWVWGFFGSIFLAGVLYFIQAAGMQSWQGPVYFFSGKWYFIAPLIAGFGFQLGLFRAILMKGHASVGPVAASGGVSSSSMIACCAHNFVPLIPLVGLGGLAAFLSRYQDYIFIVSIFVAIGGMIYLWRQYRDVTQQCHAHP
jgi:uncharacterized membrane protein YiaA